nr:hypothetical protein CFP56_46621 [Quercus suber]
MSRIPLQHLHRCLRCVVDRPLAPLRTGSSTRTATELLSLSLCRRPATNATKHRPRIVRRAATASNLHSSRPPTSASLRPAVTDGLNTKPQLLLRPPASMVL